LIQCFDNWLKLEKNNSGSLPVVTCWTIWLIRNKFLFESTIPSVQGALAQIRGLKVDSGAPSKYIPKRIQKPPDLVFPNVGWFDGASQNNGTMSGAGGIIKIGETTIYRWTFNCGLGSNTRAELLGAWATLTLATRLDIAQLQVLGDSKIVIDWINNKCKLCVTSLTGWKQKIRSLIPIFKDLKFEHIYREDNEEADSLSKKALLAPEGRILYSKWQDGQEGPPLSMRLFP
jgi:ribonuclease HI